MENRKIISLRTNEKKIYKQILTFMNFALNLTKQEIDLVAEVVKLNNEYEALPEDKRFKFIFSTEMRKETCVKIGLADKQFNTVLSNIKKKKYLVNGLPIIDDENMLNEALMYKPSTEGFFIEVNLINTEPEKAFVPNPSLEKKMSTEIPPTIISKPEPSTQVEEPKVNVTPSDMIPNPLFPLPQQEEEEFDINDISLT